MVWELPVCWLVQCQKKADWKFWSWSNHEAIADSLLEFQNLKMGDSNFGSSISHGVISQLSDDPLFVSNTENFSVPIVTTLLTGVENYISWRRSMEMVLGIKSKLVFVQGKIPRPDDPYQLTRWEKCNKVVLQWIVNSVSEQIRAGIIHCNDSAEAWSILQMRFAGASNGARLQQLHKEIVTLNQGEMNITTYHGRLLQLWAEQDALEDCELCHLGADCKSTLAMEKRKESFKFNQFLTGLNEAHTAVRTQILSSRPRPSLDEAYHIVLEDEMMKIQNKPVTVEVSAMNAQQPFNQNSYGNQNSGSTHNYNGRSVQKGINQGYYINKSKLFCTHCQISGHSRE